MSNSLLEKYHQGAAVGKYLDVSQFTDKAGVFGYPAPLVSKWELGDKLKVIEPLMVASDNWLTYDAAIKKLGADPAYSEEYKRLYGATLPRWYTQRMEYEENQRVREKYEERKRIEREAAAAAAVKTIVPPVKISPPKARVQTIGDLRQELKGLPDELPLFYSVDSEGNSYQYVYFTPTIKYIKEKAYGELDVEDQPKPGYKKAFVVN